MADIFDQIEVESKIPKTGRETPPEPKGLAKVIPFIAPRNLPPLPEGAGAKASYLTKKAFETLMPPGLAPGSLNPVAGTSGLSEVAERAGSQVEQAGTSLGKKGAEALAESKFGQKFPRTTAVPGTAIEIGSEMASGMLKPSSIQQNMGAEGAIPTAKIATSQLRHSKAAEKALETIVNVPKSEKGVGKIAMEHPEITKPGYYEENISGFAESVIKKLNDLKQAAQDFFGKALSKVKDKPAMKADELISEIEKSVSSQGLKSVEPGVKSAYKTINEAVKRVTEKGRDATAGELIELRQLVGHYRDSESLPKAARKVFGELYNKLNSGIQNAGKTGEMAAADKLYGQTQDKLERVQNALGAEPKTDLDMARDASKIEGKVKNLLKKGDLESKATEKALNDLDPNLAEEAKKLAAAGPGEGRFASIAPQGVIKAATTVSLPALGYAIAKNPAMAPFFAAITAAGAAASPRMAGIAARSLKAVEQGLPKLPGAGTVVNRAFKRKKEEDKKRG